MTIDAVLPVLQKHPFVAGIEPSQVERLARIAKVVAFAPGQVVFHEGEASSEFFLIVNGRVALEIASPGHDFRVETLSAGDEFGWSSILAGRGKLFQARALEPVEALSFDGADLRSLCESDTAFGYALMLRLLGVVSERLQATRLQVLDMYWTPAKRAGA
jgi:CRP-like cAMP-binding protein